MTKNINIIELNSRIIIRDKPRILNEKQILLIL